MTKNGTPAPRPTADAIPAPAATEPNSQRVAWGGPEPTGPNGETHEGDEGTVTAKSQDLPNGASSHMTIKWDNGTTTTESTWKLDPA